MENKNLPAFPPNAGWEHSEAKGLTKREYFAVLAMQGMLANSKVYNSCETAAKIAVQCADALLEQLSKQ